jgi:hypothetical protein
MRERSLRYIRAERANAWKQVGWSVISGPLSMPPPAGLEGGAVRAIDVVIMEWQQPGQPVEPNGEPAAGRPDAQATPPLTSPKSISSEPRSMDGSDRSGCRPRVPEIAVHC